MLKQGEAVTMSPTASHAIPEL
eukprot:COSAG04_NODE_32524_length_236_cov_6.284672_1_plen_21_part_01